MEKDDDRSNPRAGPETALSQARGRQFFGRETELSELRERLELRDGPLQVTGAPGVGKSALLSALSLEIPCRVVDVSGFKVAEIGALIRDDEPILLDEFDSSESPVAAAAELVERQACCIIASRQSYLDVDRDTRLGALQVEAAIQLLADASGDPTTNEHLESIASSLDCIPGALVHAAERLTEISAMQLEIEIDYGAFGTSWDVAEWGVSLRDHTAPWRGALTACAVFEAEFDLDAFEAATGDKSGEVLQELWRASLVEMTTPTLYRMTWPIRQLVRCQAPPSAEERRVVGLHFVARAEQMIEDEGQLQGFVLDAVEWAFEFGLIHDADLAARAAITLAESQFPWGRPPGESIDILEAALSRRERVIGDQLTAHLMVLLGACQMRKSMYPESHRSLQQALVLSPETKLLARAYEELGLLYDFVEDFDAAYNALDEAQKAFERLGLEDDVWSVKAKRSIVSWTLGNYQVALDAIEEVVEARPTPYHLYTIGWMRAHFGHVEQGRDALVECIDKIALEDQGSATNRHHATTQLGAHARLLEIEILEGNETAASARLETMKTGCSAASSNYNYLTSLMNLQLRFGELEDAFVTAHQVMGRGDGFASWVPLLLDAIRALLGRPVTSPTPHAASPRAMYAGRLAHRDLCLEFVSARRAGDHAALSSILRRIEKLSDECRNLGTRILLADLSSRVAASLPDAQRLVVGPGVSWARVRDCDPVDLRRSSTTRGLLKVLVEKHRLRPGDACSTQELFESAWPGEVWSLSAQTRFHTAVHRLRQRVLGELVETVEGGYSLSAGVILERDMRTWEELVQ